MCPPLHWRGDGGEAPNKKDLVDLCYDIRVPIFDSTIQTETAMNYTEKTNETDLLIPPHTITPEQEVLISQALKAEKIRIEDKSTKE